MASCTVTPLMAGSCDGQHVKAYYNQLRPSGCCRTAAAGGGGGGIPFKKVSSPEKEPLQQPQQKRRRALPDSLPIDMDPTTEAQLEWIFSQLTHSQLETAARTSYEFLCEPSSEASVFARQVALRYLQSNKGDEQEALRKLRATLAFREQVDMDGLRQAFDDHTWDNEHSQMLEKFLASGKNYVSCFDKEGRSTHIFVPRNTVQHHEEWTLKETYYTMERAIACSKAPGRSVNVILDFAGFNPVLHSPPISLGKEFVLTMRQHYAGQIHKIFIVDAPSSFWFLWKIFQPFVGKATQDKIVFCSGTKQKEAVFGEYYTPDQAFKWMRPNDGLKTTNFDLNDYLYKTPFDRAFDE